MKHSITVRITWRNSDMNEIIEDHSYQMGNQSEVGASNLFFTLEEQLKRWSFKLIRQK